MIRKNTAIILAFASYASALKTSSKGIGIRTNRTPAPRMERGVNVDELINAGRNGLKGIDEALLKETGVLENALNEGVNEVVEIAEGAGELLDTGLTNEVAKITEEAGELFDTGLTEGIVNSNLMPKELAIEYSKYLDVVDVFDEVTADIDLLNLDAQGMIDYTVENMGQMLSGVEATFMEVETAELSALGLDAAAMSAEELFAFGLLVDAELIVLA